MYRTRSLMKGLLAVSLVAILSSYGLAAAERDYNTTGETHDTDGSALRQDSGVIGMQHQESLVRASKLIGKPVKNTEGKTIGTVYDLVLTPDHDGISYVALSSGGLFGIGRRLHAVPWSAVQMGVGNAIVIPADEYELKQARGFSEIYWPSEGDPRWAGGAGERTQEVTFGAQTVADRENVQNRRISRIRGMTVDERHGRTVGTVRDLVFAADSGRIAYTIVSHGGLLGLGSRWTAVPAAAITFLPDRRFARLDVDRQTLVANSFNPAQMPNLSDPVYARDIHQEFNVEPGTTVLGYVAPEEPSVAAGAPRMPEVTPAEPTEADLTATFDPARVKTVEGTVLDLGKLRSTAMGRDILWLRIRPSDGQPLVVNAGPRDYVSKQDFYVVKGDRIRLTGSDVQTAAGKHVFLPTEIIYENHVLRLRDTSGNPLWERQTMTETQRPSGATSQLPEGSRPQAREQIRDESSVLGYVPGEERATPEGTRATEFGPAGIAAIGAFDLTNAQTIAGTVAEVGKSKATEGGPDVVWLRVTGSDGRPIHVQVGPRDYISRQNFFVVSGDQVRMTGWNAPAGAPDATPVFILADITQNGHILQLRNRNGQPLWGMQPGAPGQQPDTTGRPSSERPAGSQTTPGTTQESDVTEDEMP